MILQFQYDWGQGWEDGDNPINGMELVLNVLFTSRTSNATIQGLDFVWTAKVKDKILSRTAGGKYYEGPGIRILGCNIVFCTGYISLSGKATLFECDQVGAQMVLTGKPDWFEYKCRAIPASLLASNSMIGKPGYINPVIDYKKTPYHLTKYRSKAEQVTLELSAIAILMQIKTLIKEEGQSINKLSGDVAAGVLVATILTILMDIINIILYTVFLLEMLLALLNLIIQIISYYIQPKKYKLCMEVETSFKRICEYWGLAFSSTQLQNKFKGLTWMPTKKLIPNPNVPLIANQYFRGADENFNFPNNPNHYGYFDGDFDAWIEGLNKTYNSEITILPDPNTGIMTVHWEEKHFFHTQANYTITNTGEVGNTFNLPDPHTTNLSDCPSNLMVEWPIDQADENTFNRYAGSSCKVTVSSTNVYNPQNEDQKTGRDITINACRAKRKEWMNEIETKINDLINQFSGAHSIGGALVNGLINTLQPVINMYGGHNATQLSSFNNLTNLIPNIGWMELSSDDTGMPKMFIGQDSGGDWLISKSDESIMSAESILNTGHGLDLATRGNQMAVYKNKTFALCCKDYSVLSMNNCIYDPLGRIGKVFNFDWETKNERAVKVDYGIFVTLDTNLKETVSIDGIR